MITPSGRYLGRKPDSPDSADRRFAKVHATYNIADLPPSADLRSALPPCFDQGKLGSCGPNSGAGLMAHQFPEMASTGFSRLQIYYDVRVIEGNVGEDSGVETRDVLKTLQATGAAPETDWPYDIRIFSKAPPSTAYAEASKYKLDSYSRLVAEDEYMNCLAQGAPFILGFTCYESIDSNDLARTGVMPWPNKNERVLGGHDVLVVGYDRDFKSTEAFTKSGVDPALVSDQALLIRNSWGTGWGIAGHFWMPMGYASNPSTGGDAWTGRREAPQRFAALEMPEGKYDYS